jgi:uncharacterized membrane protein
VHHRLVERTGAYDVPFLLLNFAWLLTIVFLPFASQVAAVYGAENRLAIATYIGTVAASSLCLTVLAELVYRRPALQRAGVETDELRPLGALVTTGLMLAAFALGVGLPAVNYWAILLLLLSDPVERMLARRMAPQVAKSG